VQSAYAEKARLHARRQEQYRGLRDMPAVSRDGVAIDLHMNAGLLLDLPHLNETGAASIGLFRTEILFMVAPRFPTMTAQLALYKSILDAVPDHPVTFRTLDIGGDKVLPYMRPYEEENPALGWRAIRIGLDRPGLLRSQLRAMLRAGGGRDLRIMFPMIAAVSEFDAAKAMVKSELRYLERHSYERPANLKLGIMVEIPSILWQLDEVLTRVDFLSVGSNDLLQYLCAADRDNKRVSDRYDPLSAPLLRALKMITDKAQATDTPVTLCGEIGGHPLEAMALIGIGYRGFSMNPSSLGPVKAMVLALDVAEIETFMARQLASNDGAPSLRRELRTFAEAKNIPL
jgi:phosphotransferase system enzyme I (PtsP)